MHPCYSDTLVLPYFEFFLSLSPHIIVIVIVTLWKQVVKISSSDTLTIGKKKKYALNFLFKDLSQNLLHFKQVEIVFNISSKI